MFGKMRLRSKESGCRYFIIHSLIHAYNTYALGEWKSIKSLSLQSPKLMLGRQKCKYWWNKMMLALLCSGYKLLLEGRGRVIKKIVGLCLKKMRRKRREGRRAFFLLLLLHSNFSQNYGIKQATILLCL